MLDKDFMESLRQGKHLEGLGTKEEIDRALAISRKFPFKPWPEENEDPVIDALREGKDPNTKQIQ